MSKTKKLPKTASKKGAAPDDEQQPQVLLLNRQRPHAYNKAIEIPVLSENGSAQLQASGFSA